MSQQYYQTVQLENGIRVRSTKASFYMAHALNPEGQLLPLKIDIHAPFGGLHEFKDNGFMIVDEHKSTNPGDPVISLSKFDPAGNVVMDDKQRKRRALLEPVRVTREFFDEMERRQRAHALVLAQRRQNMPQSQAALQTQMAAQAAAKVALDLAAAQQAAHQPAAEQPQNEQRGKGK